MVEPERPQMAIQYGAEKMQEYRSTLIICNTYCFSTATVVTRTRLHVTCIRTLPALFGFQLAVEEPPVSKFPYSKPPSIKKITLFSLFDCVAINSFFYIMYIGRSDLNEKLVSFRAQITLYECARADKLRHV
jgi:hypothetical protein